MWFNRGGTIIRGAFEEYIGGEEVFFGCDLESTVCI